MPNLKDVGDRLRELRRRSGLTQEQLARKSGTSRPTIVRYESGEVSKLDELQRIAHVFEAELRVVLVAQGDQALVPAVADGMGSYAGLIPPSTEAMLLAQMVDRLPDAARRELVGIVHGWALGRGYTR